MPKYSVTVKFTQEKQKEISVFARNEGEALTKAEEIVSGWDGVVDTEATDVEEA